MKSTYSNLIALLILFFIVIVPFFIPLQLYEVVQPWVLIALILLYISLWFLPRFSLNKKGTLFLKIIKTIALIGLLLQLWLWGALAIIEKFLKLI